MFAPRLRSVSTLPPGIAAFSYTVTCGYPSCFRVWAAVRPAAPAPITAIRAFVDDSCWVIVKPPEKKVTPHYLLFATGLQSCYRQEPLCPAIRTSLGKRRSQQTAGHREQTSPCYGAEQKRKPLSARYMMCETKSSSRLACTKSRFAITWKKSSRISSWTDRQTCRALSASPTTVKTHENRRPCLLDHGPTPSRGWDPWHDGVWGATDL